SILLQLRSSQPDIGVVEASVSTAHQTLPRSRNCFYVDLLAGSRRVNRASREGHYLGMLNRIQQLQLTTKSVGLRGSRCRDDVPCILRPPWLSWHPSL